MKDRLSGFAALFLVSAALAGGSPFPLDAQTSGVLSGMVLDEASLEAVDGTTVVILGANRTTQTEADGSFSFSEVSAGSLNLRVSMPGYITMVETIEVAPGENTFVQFHLPRLEAMLEELIVQGGREREDRRTGASISEIVPTEEERSLSAADLLAQRVPGLQISRAGESTGAELVVHLRSVRSVTQSSEPVIYLNGARIGGAGPTGRTSASRGLRILEEIPASDIERIRILRGASAASMYADAANGVILIESRHGGSSRDGGPER